MRRAIQPSCCWPKYFQSGHCRLCPLLSVRQLSRLPGLPRLQMFLQSEVQQVGLPGGWEVRHLLPAPNREVKTNTAKQLAVKYGVKYIETELLPVIQSSSHILLIIILGINHNIDELLVGIFTQINLRQKSHGHSLNKVKLFIYITNIILLSDWYIYIGNFLGNLFRNRGGNLGKSCSNLNVL